MNRQVAIDLVGNLFYRKPELNREEAYRALVKAVGMEFQLDLMGLPELASSKEIEALGENGIQRLASHERFLTHRTRTIVRVGEELHSKGKQETLLGELLLPRSCDTGGARSPGLTTFVHDVYDQRIRGMSPYVGHLTGKDKVLERIKRNL